VTRIDHPLHNTPVQREELPSRTPSSRGESRPPALTDPYVTVSRHTALVVLICQKVLTHAQWAKAFGYWPVMRCQPALAFLKDRTRLNLFRRKRTK